MSEQWWALFRPGRPDPEAVDYNKSDLISLALRRVTGLANCVSYFIDDSWLNRDAAWKRLRRRGWRIEPLPWEFWEEETDSEAFYRGREAGYAEIRRSPESFDLPPLHMPELLKELAEDRHKLGLEVEEGWTNRKHTGTLRTCRDRLCDAAATLLGRG